MKTSWHYCRECERAFFAFRKPVKCVYDDCESNDIITWSEFQEIIQHKFVPRFGVRYPLEQAEK